MPNTREKLVELLYKCEQVHERDLNDDWVDGEIEAIVDHLIAHGVTVQKKGWVKFYPGAFYPYSCSECGNCHSSRVNFCSRCGTKLDLFQLPEEVSANG